MFEEDGAAPSPMIRDGAIEHLDRAESRGCISFPATKTVNLQSMEVTEDCLAPFGWWVLHS